MDYSASQKQEPEKRTSIVTFRWWAKSSFYSGLKRQVGASERGQRNDVEPGMRGASKAPISECSWRLCDAGEEPAGQGQCGQATKGMWGMSRRQKAMKGVEDCDKSGGAVKRALMPEYPNRYVLNP